MKKEKKQMITKVNEKEKEKQRMAKYKRKIKNFLRKLSPKNLKRMF